MRFVKICCCLWTMLFWTLLMGRTVASAAQNDQRKLYQDQFYYTVTAQNEITVKSARASVTSVNVPPEIDGMPVTAIGSYAFQECTRLEKLVLPDSIQKIGDFAFMGCDRLETLVIPETTEQIGWGAVSDTLWLEKQCADFVVAGKGILLAYKGTEAEVVIPDGVAVISGYAFSACENVNTVQLPDSMLKIDAFSFDNCVNLRQVLIPEGVTTIGQYAFHWCPKLEEIFMPDSVVSVENHAFSYCKSLQYVKLSSGLKQLSNSVFSDCLSLSSIEIPQSIESINNYAFQHCSALQSVTIPASVTFLGSGAFEGCTSLEELTIENPACRIVDETKTISPTAKICGAVVSTAQIYAQKYERAFLPTNGTRGDVNLDGSITLADAYDTLMISSYLALGMRDSPTNVELYTADYNRDGEITISDAYDILMYTSMVAILRPPSDMMTE